MRAVGCHRNANTFFRTPFVFLSRIRDHRIPRSGVGFGMQGTKTLTYPVMCQFPLFVTLACRAGSQFTPPDTTVELRCRAI